MSIEEKKAYLLLKCIVFSYHGMDEDEQMLINETADQLDATAELKWAQEFVNQDILTAHDRCREYLVEHMKGIAEDRRVKFLVMVWDASNTKGYITEMEATAMLRFAKDWGVDKKFVESIRNR